MLMRSRKPAARLVAANVAGALVVVAVLAIALAATQVRDPARLRPGISTAADVPGTCHRDLNMFETTLAQAELTPPVPCSRPHNIEVVWTVPLGGILAAQHDRPTPEMMNGQYAGVCNDPSRLRRYVGVPPDAPGYLYFLQLYPRFPSAPEWRAGVRTARCVAQWTGQQGAQLPTLTFSLRDSWAGAGSAAIRLCANAAYAYVACSQPHTQEVLEPVSPFPAGQQSLPSPALSRRLGLPWCTAEALRFLVRSAIPNGLHVVVEPAEQRNWPGNRDVGCRIVSARRTGSLQGGLT